ncbi:MAG: DUF2269 domain-containing protein [Gammaproteobacteria bacterium]
MDSYLYLKLLHILSATILAGTGIGTAFFMFMASRSDDIHAIAVTTRHVVLADWIFTTPAIVIQLVTGIWLMKMLGYSFTSPWFITSIGLFIFIGACWIPVVFIQYQLRAIAITQLAKSTIEPRFRQLMRRWTILGILAFTAIVVIFWIMVVKPLSVT